MAKTLSMPSPAALSVFKKAYTGSVLAKVSVGCTLHDLCAEDKSKVAKLLRQVVELERELTQTKAQGKKEKTELQEKAQHLRQRSADMLQENNTLKAKLTHAFALLRAYQLKVKHMDEAATTAPDLHSSNASSFKRPQQLCCQRCGHTARLSSSDQAVRLKHDGQAPSQLEPLVVLSADSSRQHSAGIGSHHQHISRPVQCLAGGQHERQQASAQTSHTVGIAAGRQGPFSELASKVLAWQQDESASERSAQQAAAEEACKVLRFDPTLGNNGAFYFITPQSSETQPQPAGQCEQNQAAPDSSSSDQQAASAPVQQQTSGSTDGFASHHVQLPGPEAVRIAAQSRWQRDSPQPDVVTGGKARQVSPDEVSHSDSRDGRAMAAEIGSAQVQLVQAPAAKAIGEHQAGVQIIQPSFPVQGGGEAGVLLRAAAAAEGCSHELMVAAAGRACLEEEPGSASRPVSHSTSVQPAPASVSDTYATSSSPGQGMPHADPKSGSMPNPGQAGGQSGHERNEVFAVHGALLDAGAGRVESDEDLHSLGFDSSLMDLVTEVEQMVAYKQANVASADRQPWPAHDRCRPSRAALLHRCPSTQGPGEEEDFEENDVISLISDQEYSIY